MNSDFIVAVHAVVYLNRKADVVSSGALAENICTNPARVRKVMAPLKRAGLVETREGNVGGYRFVGDARKVSLRDLADALGTRFVQSSWYSGDEDMDCLIACGMAGVLDEVFSDLDRCCLERLDGITIADIDARIFAASCAFRPKDEGASPSVAAAEQAEGRSASTAAATLR